MHSSIALAGEVCDTSRPMSFDDQHIVLVLPFVLIPSILFYTNVYTQITEVNLSAFDYKLFYEDVSTILLKGFFMKISLHTSELMSGEKSS